MNFCIKCNNGCNYIFCIKCYNKQNKIKNVIINLNKINNNIKQTKLLNYYNIIK